MLRERKSGVIGIFLIYENISRLTIQELTQFLQGALGGNNTLPEQLQRCFCKDFFFSYAVSGITLFFEGGEDIYLVSKWHIKPTFLSWDVVIILSEKEQSKEKEKNLLTYT